jgi:hypothetical protein
MSTELMHEEHMKGTKSLKIAVQVKERKMKINIQYPEKVQERKQQNKRRKKFLERILKTLS